MTHIKTRCWLTFMLALLALCICSAGIAEEANEDSRHLIFNGVPDEVTLYLSDNHSENITTQGTAYMYSNIHMSDWSNFDNISLSLTCKNPQSGVLSNIIGTSETHSFSTNTCGITIKYDPVRIGTCIYTLTASIPGTDYTVSKDITFTVTDDTSGLPTSIEIDSKYFDENSVYKEELVIDEASGTAVIANALNSIVPKFTINGIENRCGSYGNSGNGFKINNGDFVFSKAGKHTITFFTSENSSNWRLSRNVTFIVKYATEPQNPITLTGVPTEDMLIANDVVHIKIAAENPEQLVYWDVSSNNNDIHVSKNVSYDGNTLSLNVYSSVKGAKDTITIKAYYYGYEDKATVATFNVYTPQKQLLLYGSPDNITLYIDNDNPAVSNRTSLILSAEFDDYKTPIENVEFSFIRKDSGKDVIDGITIVQNASQSSNGLSWYTIIGYSPIATGTCVYTFTASIPGTDYTVSKDITFTVTDDTSGLPTSIEIDSKYFDENGVYKEELVIDEASGTAVIDNVWNNIVPKFTINGIDKQCGISNSGSDFKINNGDFVFSKAGKYTISFIAREEGSNWRLSRNVTFIVKSATEPQNPITLTGVPTGDMLITNNTMYVEIAAENPEQLVYWDVSASNDDIHIDKNVSYDGNTLILSVSSSVKGAKDTITIKAYYYGYENKATVATFNVYTESENGDLISEIPDTITLYLVDDDDSQYNFYRYAYFSDFINLSNHSIIESMNFNVTCADSENSVIEGLSTSCKPLQGTDNAAWHVEFEYAPVKVGSTTYTFTIDIPGTEYRISKDVTFIVKDDTSGLPKSVDTNPKYFDEDGLFIGSTLTMPEDGSPLVISFPEEAIPTFMLNGERKVCSAFNWGSARYDRASNSLVFNKAGKYTIKFYAEYSNSNWSLEKQTTFIVKSNTEPTESPIVSGLPTESVLVGDRTEIQFQSVNSSLLTKWEVSCDNDAFTVNGYPIPGSEASIDILNVVLSCTQKDASGTVTVKAYYYGYEDKTTTLTFNVHTASSKVTLVPDMRKTITLYSGENDGQLEISTSGTFYLGSLAFSDASSLHEYEPVITLTPNDEGGAFEYSIYSYNGYDGGEDGQHIKIAKLKYESLPSVGTHEYTLNFELPGTDYSAQTTLVINVVDDLSILPRAIELNPETEALFTNNVYNRNLYLNDDGKVSVSLDFSLTLDEEAYQALKFVLDKYTDDDENCTKSYRDGKYVFTFEGAKTHYIYLHLASDFSNWHIDRTLSFNVLNSEPTITDEPFYPPFDPTTAPTAEPTVAPTSEPIPTVTPTVAPTVAPTAEPTPTPAPIKQVTTGGSKLNVRLSPVNGQVVAKLPNGTKLEVLGTENGWSRVRATLPDGSVVEGFVMDAYLTPTATPTAAPTPAVTPQPDATPTVAPSGAPTGTPTAPAPIAAKVSTGGSALRLRGDPSTRSDILVRMPNNAAVTVLETKNGWARIKFTAADGREYEGWASSEFIKPDQQPTATPTPSELPAPTTTPLPTATPAPNSAAQVNAGGKRLNMRTQPSTGSDIAVKLPAGAEIIVLEYGPEWSLCSYNGVIGYCSTAYLRFN